MNLLLIDWLFYDFSGAKGDVSGWVEICGSLLEGSESGSVGFDFSQLILHVMLTLLSLSRSWILTILPNDGITLMLMDLYHKLAYPSGPTWFWNDIFVLFGFIYIFIEFIPNKS